MYLVADSSANESLDAQHTLTLQPRDGYIASEINGCKVANGYLILSQEEVLSSFTHHIWAGK